MSEELPPPEIHNRGRGPEIKGTRITVYDILDYHLGVWTPERIAEWLRLTPDHVREAIRYIGDHTDEVIDAYNRILKRSAQGNPPELQAKLDAIHEEMKRYRAERRRHKEAESPS